MIKLKTITIKGMHNYDSVTYNLGDFTYLFGKNGAGKSTVLEAIQFALLGYIPGYNKTPAGVLSHCNNDKGMSVKLVLNDGEKDITIVRECTKFGGKASVNVTCMPQVDLAEIIKDIEAPVFNFGEFIGMTANKLKEWFISFLGNNGSELVWDKIFTLDNGTDVALQKSVLEYVNDKPVDIEHLKDVNTYLKSLQSAKKADLERIISTIQSMVVSEDTTISADDVDKLRAEIETLTVQKTYAIQYEERQRHNSLIETKLNGDEYANLKDTLDEDEEYYSAIEELLDLKSKLSTIETQHKELIDKITKVQSESDNLGAILESNGVCPYTQKACGDITALKAEYQARQNELDAELKVLNADMNELIKCSSETHKQITTHSNTIEHKKSLYAERNRLKDSIMPLADAPEYTSVALEKQISELTDKVVAAETNLKYYRLIDNLTKDKLACENCLNMLKGWISATGANGLQSQITDGAFKVLSANMDDYIKALYGDETLKTKFVLEEKANSFSFGLVRNDKYIAYDLLSSGERCIFTLAMLLCLIANAQSELKVILLDDLLDHIDDDKIKILFKGLNDVKDIQIILAGVKKYTEANYDSVVITIV